MYKVLTSLELLGVWVFSHRITYKDVSIILFGTERYSCNVLIMFKQLRSNCQIVTS